MEKKQFGHKLRSGKKVIDRNEMEKAVLSTLGSEKKPNQYSGHTFKNKIKKFELDGHKLIYHMDRILAWQKGERIAPIHIDMGLTKFCNVGCIYCIGVTQGMTKGVMIKRDALLRFIDDCGRLGVRSISFVGDAEPTLNPAMYDAAVRAKKLGIDIGIGTNGLLLKMDRAHDLLRDCAYIRFNLSAASPESFEKIHQCKADKFNMLIDKIRALSEIKRANNYKCTLGIQMVLIPENFDQVLDLAKLGKDLKIDYFQVKQCSDTEYKEIGVNYEEYKNVEKILKKVEKFNSEDYFVKVKWNKINIAGETDLYKHGFRKYDICYGAPFIGQISGNGKVYPCGPFFGKERFFMGDIHKQSYYDIVKSDRYWQVQQDIIDNVDVHFDCTVGCRQDYINRFLWSVKNAPEHINFI